MSQPPQSPADLGLDPEPVPTRAGPGPWGVGSPQRRLVDLLQVEPGQRIGFLDDPAGRGAQLAGELLGRQSRVFLYGVSVGAGLTTQTYADDCFDLIVAPGEGRHWALVVRALVDVPRLIRPGGTVAVIIPHPLSLLERRLRRITRPGADARVAQDIAVGKRLAELFGPAVRTELGARVVWHVKREIRAQIRR